MSAVLVERPQVEGPQLERQPKLERLGLAASLLSVQAALTFVTGIEAALMAAGTGNSAGALPALASFGWAAFLLVARRRLGAGKGRRLVKWLEGSLLVWSTINLALAVFLMESGIGLMAAISGFGLPILILHLVLRKA